MKTIKQYGLQRSGTNYTRFLLVNNFRCDVVVNRAAWKHGYHNPDLSCDGVVVTTKTPFAWLTSVWKYFRKVHRRNLHDFLRSGWSFEGTHASSPVIHWNTMNAHWLSIDDPLVAVVDHDRQASDPEREMGEVADILGLERVKRKPRLGHQFISTDRKMKAGSDHSSPQHVFPNVRFDRLYYVNRVYMEMFDEDDVRLVVDEVDPVVAAQLGYDMKGII